MARTEVIPVSKEETVQGLIDRIKSTSASKIIIYSDSRAPLLRREINLRLLKFYCEEEKKELTLVVKDRVVKRKAGQLGIVVEETLERKEPEPLHQQMPIDFSVPVSTPQEDQSSVSVPSVSEEEFSKPAFSKKIISREDPQDPPRKDVTQRDVWVETAFADDSLEPVGFDVLRDRERISRRIPPEGVGARGRGRPVSTPQTSSSGKLAVALLFTLCSFLAGSYLLFRPKMTLIVYPAYRDWVFAVEGEIGLDFGDRDIIKNRLPIRLLEKGGEISYSLPTAGKKKIGYKPAVGEVVFINTNNTAIVAPKGTMVSTQTGLTFVTTRNVVVPRKTTKYLLGVATGETYGQATVEVESTEKGTIGNIEQQEIDRIVGQLSKSLQVVNMRRFTTGEDRFVSVVEENDISRAEAEARRQMSLEAMEEARKLADEEHIFLSDLAQIEVEKVSPDPPLGTESDSVSVHLTYRVKVAVLSKNVLYKCLRNHMEENLPAGFLPVGKEIAVKSLTIRGKNLRRSEFYLQSSAKLQGKIDKKKVFEAVAGKTFEEARAILTGYNEISDIEFRDHNREMKRIPSQSYQVRLVVPSER